MRNIREIRFGICAVIAESRADSLLQRIYEAQNIGANLAEIRADYLDDYSGLEKTFLESPIPLILTARRKVDGGVCNLSEEKRLGLLINAAKSGVSAIDVEEDVFKKIPNGLPCARILSLHNYSVTPPNLESILSELEGFKPDIVKIACMANSFSDTMRMLNLYSHAKAPLLGFCMGSRGFHTRLLSLRYGSPWLYAAGPNSLINAPGIPDLNDICQTYGKDLAALKGELFGVVGDPISHSMSPLIHNQGFRSIGFCGFYIPFQISREEFELALEELREIPVKGLSVTIPHKESAARFANNSSQIVKQLGAANTLVWMKNSLFAENSDAIAIVKSLTLHGSLKKKVLVLGAGGVGRAAVYSLKEAGLDVCLTNRSHSKAETLAREAGVGSLSWEDRGSFRDGIIVNCTSLGMKPDLESTPWEKHWFTKNHLAFDTVYNPLQTRFLKEALECGVEIIPGVEMFVQQAAVQFRLFTGQDPPLGEMRLVVQKKLGFGN